MRRISLRFSLAWLGPCRHGTNYTGPLVSRLAVLMFVDQHQCFDALEAEELTCSSADLSFYSGRRPGE